ncbi:XrtA/PEP-CTERM system exopolysaccharide export protein [Denitrobaculum tricleocarpae]|uniref:XrtA/PEP-CTERM system exopolysaccharide export protein n=1 Tax=Denitrobaculum tricleocarpae TaxID=2591009 RepID=UPI0015D14FBA|nr:XrtA/PEP-CTERM system exopolysaccharide export protein [Denitrobaculum tricleocarpae]
MGGVSATALSLSFGSLASATEQVTDPQENLANQAAQKPAGTLYGGEVASPDYLIGPGDVVELLVLRNPDLSGVYTVRPDGRVSTPLIEDLMVVGHTPTTLSRELEEKLSVYIQDPVVTVIVRSFSGDLRQQIRVVGEAQQPQAVAFRDRMTALDVLIAVGGLSSNADGNSAVLLRREGDTRRQIPLRLDDLVDDGDSTANIAMAPGDVIIIPEGFFSGDWRVTPTISFQETFSDNVDQDPDGEEESAFISTVRPGITFFANAARINWAFSGNVALRQQNGGDDEGADADVDLNSSGTVELFNDLFFIDGNASVSQEVLTSEGSSSGSDDNTSNRETVQNYRLSPYVTNRLGDFARMESRYTFSQVFVDSDDASDTSTHEGRLSLNSGPDFTQFSWGLSASASEAMSSDDDDVSRRDVNFSTTYAVTRSFFLIGSVGYQEFDDGDNDNEVDDPTWRTAARWQPSSRTQLEVGYGQRDNEVSFDGDLRYNITPRTTLSASYSEVLRTSQEALGQNFDNIAFDPDTGQFVNTETGQVVNSANDVPFDIDDETTRVKTFRAGINGSRDRDSFGLNFRANLEDNDNDDDESEYGVVANWGRTLNNRTSVNTSGEYEYNDLGNSIENEYTFRAGLNYSVFTNISANVNYTFRLRESDESSSDEFLENTISVGLSATF